MESLVISVLALIVAIIALVMAFRGWAMIETSIALLAEPRVAVKIYKSLETGNFIYCRTGTLEGPDHEYIGEGKIAESKAVEC